MTELELLRQERRIMGGWVCYAVGFTILVIAVVQMLTVIWLPLFGSLTVAGAMMAAEGAVRHEKPTWAMFLLLGGAVAPAIQMTAGLLWHGSGL